MKSLPRTRGDRPERELLLPSAQWSPPHTRGSTLDGGFDNARLHVSPAHAGIDLTLLRVFRKWHGLPRTRGDRPHSRCSFFTAGASPPHTRGSTLTVSVMSPVAAVSPAHAGIDPSSCAASPSAMRLPRTRGDRPMLSSSGQSGGGSPPHTRGSTRLGADRCRHRGVSPAHAGIDPRARRSLRAHLSLPRTRGDRPTLILISAAAAGSPPHTRGSTSAGQRWINPLTVSPAHAGIDPRLLVPA